MILRHLKEYIVRPDYSDKMRFIAGPRQSGKTTLVKTFLNEIHMEKLYFNWDRREIRDRYYKNAYFYNDELLSLNNQVKKWICFDEIHKIPKWKNILKDIHDTDHEKINFLITGSARLDFFRKAGDSLAGRFYLFHLFPVFLSELIGSKMNKKVLSNFDINPIKFIENILASTQYFQNEMNLLLDFSGFPEPLTENKKNILHIWRNNYLDAIIKEDLRELSAIKNLENLAKLLLLLPDRIGSPLSINSFINDIQASYPSIKNYLYYMELIYLVFKISPYSKRIIKSITKEQKYYLFDWTRIEDQSIRFENYIAFELYNFVNFLKDHGYGEFELCYVRNRKGEETDFLITLNKTPWLLMETKLNKEVIASHNLKHAKELGDIPFIQLIYKNNTARKTGKNTYIVSASRFIANII